jgi:hypothetical protein
MSSLQVLKPLFLLLGVAASSSSQGVKRHNEFVLLEGHTERENYHSPLPYTYIRQEDLPVRVCLCARACAGGWVLAADANVSVLSSLLLPLLDVAGSLFPYHGQAPLTPRVADYNLCMKQQRLIVHV